MRIAARVAQDKREHPEKFCPIDRCLWRTGDGSRCPRHPAPVIAEPELDNLDWRRYDVPLTPKEDA